MTDLVVLSLEAWDGVWRRNQHLVSRLLAADPGLRVLFVEPPADPLHALRRKSGLDRGLGLRPAGLRGAEGRLSLFQPTKWLPRKIDRWADRRLASGVVRAVRRLGMNHPVLWHNDPTSAELLRRTGWRALYDITDDWLVADRPTRERDRLVRDEQYLLAHCQHVVVCSPRLLETKTADRVTLIPNAVDIDAYRGDLPRPADLPPGPIVLYVGTLHRDRLDVDLAASLAQGLGDATFVLVGPNALDLGDTSRLTAAGAQVLGPRDHEVIPAYLKGADVLVVPHVVTPFTDSLDPIKVYEYLAAARPVVSTPVSGFRGLDPAQAVVVAADAFVARVRDLVAHPVAVKAADVPSWDERAAAVRVILDEVRGP